jgi:hypothetical protein
MPSSDAFALRRSGLNGFLFAEIGPEANGMTLSVISVLARMGNDPWVEAGRLAGLPKSEATESLARSIAGMPASIWSQQAAMAIAAGLVVLLPAQPGPSAQGWSAPGQSARTGGFFRIAVVVVCVACVVAFEAGVFTTSDAPTPDSSTLTSFVASPH